MRATAWMVIALLLSLAGCVSVGNLGLVTKGGLNPISILQTETKFQELGPTKARACRHFLLAVIPWGDSDIQTAVDKALAKSGGDALVNVTASSSLYGFIPYFNVYSITCTTVQGTAIKFIQE